MRIFSQSVAVSLFLYPFLPGLPHTPIYSALLCVLLVRFLLSETILISVFCTKMNPFIRYKLWKILTICDLVKPNYGCFILGEVDKTMSAN